MPYREPLQHSYSLLTQHKRFIKLSKKDKFVSKYMQLIGHYEFGPNYKPIKRDNLIYENVLDINHWLEQWLFCHNIFLDKLKNKKNVFLINYEELCKSKKYWLKIQKLIELESNYEFEFIESKKEIKLEFDNSLYKNATNLYSKLKSLKLPFKYFKIKY